ncbi:hypothetical protein [Nocardioides sambongensis]|uniref:hypothetical protein n=1 Tax=Nocardioides sambongensis TaxID=2589074 RepID=UPI00112B220B|nr:hypothetical protein [Nocardioides sambongensis]
MGWEDELFALFDELEQQAGALYAAERDAEVADRSRAEYQEVSLAGRLMASVDSEVTLGIEGVGAVTGTLERVAGGWTLLAARDQDWVVRLDAVATVEGASVRAIPAVAWSPVARLGIGSALRRLSEAGERCVVHLRDGSRHDGTLRRVGQDFCELVTGEERRTLLLPFHAVAAVQSRR